MADHCHNTSGSPTQASRRNLLKALPAVGIMPAVAGFPALADADTPVMRLFREREKHRAYLDSPEGLALPDPEFNAVLGVCHDLEVRMINTPSQCAQDFIAKLLSWTDEGALGAPEPEEFPGFWAEARALMSA